MSYCKQSTPRVKVYIVYFVINVSQCIVFILLKSHLKCANFKMARKLFLVISRTRKVNKKLRDLWNNSSLPKNIVNKAPFVYFDSLNIWKICMSA